MEDDCPSLHETQAQEHWHIHLEELFERVKKKVRYPGDVPEVSTTRETKEETKEEVLIEYILKKIEDSSRVKLINKQTMHVVVAGGKTGGEISSSVEMFSLLQGNWTPLIPMIEGRSDASSVLYNDQFIVTGGVTNQGQTNTMEILNVVNNSTTTWETISAQLAGKLAGHRSVVYNGRLIVIGGYDGDTSEYTNSITGISPISPYTSTQLNTMPHKIAYHGVAIFDNKILIVGGKDGLMGRSIFRSVYMYNITENSIEELAPLPYPVCEMATIKWGNDNVMIMGGVDWNLRPLNSVLMYKVSTKTYFLLPPMRYARKGCVAVVAGNNAIVMGGEGINGECLNSVEKFNFRNYEWEELPEMREGRHGATAVAY